MQDYSVDKEARRSKYFKSKCKKGTAHTCRKSFFGDSLIECDRESKIQILQVFVIDHHTNEKFEVEFPKDIKCLRRLDCVQRCGFYGGHLGRTEFEKSFIEYFIRKYPQFQAPAYDESSYEYGRNGIQLTIKKQRNRSSCCEWFGNKYEFNEDGISICPMRRKYYWHRTPGIYTRKCRLLEPPLWLEFEIHVQGAVRKRTEVESLLETKKSCRCCSRSKQVAQRKSNRGERKKLRNAVNVSNVRRKGVLC